MASLPFSSRIDTIMTIERHILEQQRFHPEATGVLTNLLYDIAFRCPGQVWHKFWAKLVQ